MTMTMRAALRGGEPLVGDESEAHFQQRFLRAARALGWERSYHTLDSMGSAPGFPDLFLLNKRQRRGIFVELKSQHGVVKRDQREWNADLKDCGFEAYIFYPSDWALILETLKGAA